VAQYNPRRVNVGDRVQYSTVFLAQVQAPRELHAADGRGTVTAVREVRPGGPLYLNVSWDKPELHESGGALSTNMTSAPTERAG
jgi:hypothetical protein